MYEIFFNLDIKKEKEISFLNIIIYQRINIKIKKYIYLINKTINLRGKDHLDY